MKLKASTYFVAAALFAASLPALADPLRFSVKELGMFNPTGINSLGQVSGWNNGDNGPLAVLYNGSTLANVGSPSGSSFANGINDSGQLAGTYGTDASPGNGQAFTYTASTFRSIGPADSGANAINNAGHVAGALLVDGNSHAFVYSNNTLTDLTSGKPAGAGGTAAGLSNNGHVVGSMWDSEFGEHHAFLYANGVTTDLSNVVAGFSSASAVNNSGQVIMTVDNRSTGGRDSYLYADGAATNLGSLGLSDTYAHGINSAGIVVGTSAGWDLPYGAGGFIWQNGALQDLNALIDPASGWIITGAAGINDNNQIAAYGCRFGECQGLLLSVQAVPEPETYAMLGAGLGLIGYATRRRRSRSVA